MLKYHTYFFLLFVFVKDCYSTTPIFGGLPTTMNVGEDETGERCAYVLTVTDADGDPHSCQVQTMTPSWGPMEVTWHTKLLKYCLMTKITASERFDYANTTEYVMTFRCDDNGGVSAISDPLTVKVMENSALAFLNTPMTATISAQTAAVPFSMYNVSVAAQNPFGAITCSYTGSSDFTLDAATGELTNNEKLNKQTAQSVSLWITCTDGRISLLDELVIDFTDLNNIPRFSGITSPYGITVPEDYSSTTPLITLTPIDGDIGATLSTALTSVTPASEWSRLSYTGNTIRLATGQSFDYERASSIVATVTVTDTIATFTQTFSVTISNVPEACYFSQALYHATAPEGGIGTANMNPGFVVFDYDNTAVYTLSFLNANQSNLFTITDVGKIDFAVNYDIDNNVNPSTVYLTCICTDTSSSLTGTTQVLLTITDINDNTPSFASTTSLIQVNQFTAAGTIASVLPVDPDSGLNGERVCSVTSNTDTSNFFSVLSNCGVVLNTNPSTDAAVTSGQSWSYTITGTDKGTPPLSSTHTFVIQYTEIATTTTTTTTTTVVYNVVDDPGALAAIICASVLGALLVGLLLYYLLRCCFIGHCCGPEPCDFCNICRNPQNSRNTTRTITPQEYKSSKPKAAEEYDYYNDKNFDSDYESLKNEETRPRVHGGSRYHRTYPDFPQSQSGTISPSDAYFDMRPTPRRMAPIGYY